MSSRSKVKFLYLGSPWSDLHETWCVYTGSSLIKIYGSNWVKGNRGKRSNLYVVFFSTQVLGPIFTKLGGKVEGGPGY